MGIWILVFDLLMSPICCSEIKPFSNCYDVMKQQTYKKWKGRGNIRDECKGFIFVVQYKFDTTMLRINLPYPAAVPKSSVKITTSGYRTRPHTMLPQCRESVGCVGYTATCPYRNLLLTHWCLGYVAVIIISGHTLPMKFMRFEW